MKRHIFSFILCLSTLSLIAQSDAPTGFQWQGIFRKAGGSLLSQEDITVQFSIIEDLDGCDGSGDITTVYEEEHLNKPTNQFGLLNLILGEGDSLSGNWNTIEWGRRCYFLQINAITPTGSVSGMSKIVGVPFANSSGDWVNVGDTILHSNNRKVGIGTTSPEAPLHVIDTDVTLSGGGGVLVGEIDGLNIAIDRNEIMARKDGSAHILYLQLDGGELKVHNNLHDSTKVVIDTLGYVGIGTDEPKAYLHIPRTPDVSPTGGGALVLGYVSGKNLSFDNNEIMARKGVEKSTLHLQSEGGDFRVHTLQSGGTDFIIKDNGKVGIGTSVPEDKLHVSDGTIRVSHPDLNLHTRLFSSGMNTMFNGNNRISSLLSLNGEFGQFATSGGTSSNSTNVSITSFAGHSGNGAISVHNDQGQAKAGAYVDENGKGIIWGDMKYFVAPHPLDSKKEIYYASLEGPEAAMYERGTSELNKGEKFVKFSVHFRLLADFESMTVILTPHSADTYGLAVTDKTPDGFKVKELKGGNGKFGFDWEVKCIRKGYENFQVIRPKLNRISEAITPARSK